MNLHCSLRRIYYISRFDFHEVIRMINGYKTSKEIAKEWSLSERRVQILCAEGRIEGAAKLGRKWAIPINAERPRDSRFTTGCYKNWRKK